MGRFLSILITVLLTAVFVGCGSGSSGGGGGGGAQPPAAPTGLQATAGNAQVSLTWNASSGATSYNVKRSTTNGGPYTTIASPTTNSYTDTGLNNGTPYYYVVTAVNSAGESSPSAQATATPTATTAVTVSIDTLSNRHTISPYVYGGAFPQDAPTIKDSGLTLVRWGGNASSTYNWNLGTDNADNDYFFEDFNFGALNNSADSDSTQFIKDVQAAGSNPLMTMVMMNWVAQSAETPGPTGNLHWTFSKSIDGAQCKYDVWNSDAGNGQKPDCSTQLTASSADINRTYFPLLDDSSEPCPSWATAGCTNAVYRNTWAAALATAFGSTSTCPIPYFPSLTSCHFYDMDNEIDIWGGTHFDIHPNPSGYEELRDTYLTEARNLKGWDPAAVRLGPVSCCWWFYWNGANSSDKGAHAGQDFLPWWLNEVYWRDQIDGVQSLDIFDIHAYPDGPNNISSASLATQRAAAVSIYRDYWDATFTSPSSTINQTATTSIQPNYAIPFRIPRMRAIANVNYPGVPLAFTEWSAAFAGEADFSTALGDADAYGILGRERMSLATRWEAPLPTNPNYQALKLFTDYDGALHKFGTTSVSATHNADPDLFSVYAALGTGGTSLTIMVLNKDPANAANVSFTVNNFTGASCTAYTLSQSSPTAIVSSSCTWGGSMTFAPYTATLLVVTGAQASVPAAEWDLNPDTTMVPAGGSVTLNPTITSGTPGATVTLTAASFDSGGGSMSITNANLTQAANGAISVTAGTTSGFYHFTVTSKDSSNVTQKQGGWLIIGNPPATFTNKTGDQQTGGVGTQLPVSLSITLAPGSSGGTASGATIRFTTNAGTLSGGTAGNATTQLVTTNASGVAAITLTLPATAGTVHVTAEGPFQLGHPVTIFTETAN
jgi:hypothetical protein